MRDRAAMIAATFFGVGRFPVAPGTGASLAGALLAVGLQSHPWLLGAMILGVCLAGVPSSTRAEILIGKKDPGCVVIDEVAGVLIAFAGLPVNAGVFWTAFFLFRAFDMFKIYPADVLEKRGGGWGIMMDDIVAGVYTNVTMRVALYLSAFFIGA